MYVYRTHRDLNAENVGIKFISNISTFHAYIIAQEADCRKEVVEMHGFMRQVGFM
jgi:hypothetical protein